MRKGIEEETQKKVGEMNILLILLGSVVMLDFFLIPFLFSAIRKDGGFHILMSTLHKVFLLTLVFVIVVVFHRYNDVRLIQSIATIAIVLFVFNKTLEINDYLFRFFRPEECSSDGMSEDSTELMKLVIEDMMEQNKKPMSQRFKSMVNNFKTNLGQDFSVLFMLITDDKTMKEGYVEIHKMMGNDRSFANMSNKDMLFMTKNRIQVDIMSILLVLIIFFN